MKTKPTNAEIINSNSICVCNGLPLNAMVALNANIPLGGSDRKTGKRPDSALVWKIDPNNGKVLKGYNYTVPTPVGVLSGQPVGLLLSITYP